MTKPEVLFIEDDIDDRTLMLLAFKQFKFPYRIKIALDGEEAWDQLRNSTLAGGLAGVILDINSPKISGLDLLKRIRSRKPLRTLPVVVLTSSDDPRDVATARDLGVSDYLIKPMAFKGLEDIVQRLNVLLGEEPS